MSAVQNLSSMTQAQLKNYLFGDADYEKMSFSQATADYMQTMSETEATSLKTATESMTTETDAQDAVTSLTKNLSAQYTQELQEQQEMQPSSMPSWLGDIVAAFSVLASIVTLNPVMIGISTTAFVLQVSGLQQKMMDAACGNDVNKQAAFSFGFAMGEALIGGTASCVGDSMVLTQAAASGAKTVAQTTGQVALNFVKYTMTYLGQTLMLDNFWPEFFQGPCGMSQEDAVILGMFVGIGCGIASSIVAGSSEDGLTQMTRNEVNKLSDKAQNMFHILTTGIHLIGDGLQLGSGVETLKISDQYKNLSAFEKDVIAATMGNLAQTQSVSTGLTSMLSQTQNLIQTLNSDSALINQTFSSYGEMFRQAQ